MDFLLHVGAVIVAAWDQLGAIGASVTVGHHVYGFYVSTDLKVFGLMLGDWQ